VRALVRFEMQERLESMDNRNRLIVHQVMHCDVAVGQILGENSHVRYFNPVAG
jgi:hypothetical protein